VLRALSCALGFLTRFPVPQVTLSERDVARSAGFFAWVGLLIGGLLWASHTGLAWVGLRQPLVAVVLVSLWAWATGALHLDGLADTVDGLSGGRGKAERALEIMRDSRIGAHGAVALVLGLLLKCAALARALELEGQVVWCVPAVARFGCTLLLAHFPYARQSGLGSAFAGAVGWRELAWGVPALVLPLAWLSPGGWGAYAGTAALGLGCALALALRVRRALGGLTGDVHGAAIEVCEIAMLVGLSAFRLP
jgi:adenosylcobinamide-GDP ribazoletransferase